MLLGVMGDNLGGGGEDTVTELIMLGFGFGLGFAELLTELEVSGLGVLNSVLGAGEFALQHLHLLLQLRPSIPRWLHQLLRFLDSRAGIHGELVASLEPGGDAALGGHHEGVGGVEFGRGRRDINKPGVRVERLTVD